MSTNQREVAKRTFAREFNGAELTFAESDDEFAPQYVMLPTGERMNRMFAVGTLTEVEDVGNEGEYWRGRVIDPTGTFFVYAGEYQPEAMGALQQASPPSHVAVVGKPRTYETDDGDVNVAVRPEHIVEVGQKERQQWIVETATRTLERIEAFHAGETDDVVRAREYYGEDVTMYLEAVIEALEGLETNEPVEASP